MFTRFNTHCQMVMPLLYCIWMHGMV